MNDKSLRAPEYPVSDYLRFTIHDLLIQQRLHAVKA